MMPLASRYATNRTKSAVFPRRTTSASYAESAPIMKTFLQLEDGSRMQLRQLTASESHVVFVIASRSDSPFPVGSLEDEHLFCELGTSVHEALSQAGRYRNQVSSPVQANIPILNSVPANTPKALRVPRAPPSGKVPNPRQKIWCTYWIGHGECGFEQQGCMYKHEMPDLQTLKRIGFRDVPQWYRKQLRQKRLADKSLSGSWSTSSSSQAQGQSPALYMATVSQPFGSGTATGRDPSHSSESVGDMQNGCVLNDDGTQAYHESIDNSSDLIDLDLWEAATASASTNAGTTSDSQSSIGLDSDSSDTSTSEHLPPSTDQVTILPCPAYSQVESRHGIIGQERQAQSEKHTTHR